MARLRVACVGTGFIAGKHLAALSGFDGVDVVAMADPDARRAAAAAQALGARTYADGVELLQTEDLDAVWFCVPPFAHGPLEAAAVRRNVPFFVEKPLAHDLVTAQRIAARVEDAGLLTAVGYHWRYLDLVDRARAIVAERPPLLLLGHWLDSTPPAPWWLQRDQSGGQVVEQTTHILDLARLLVGEVADLQTGHVPVPADDRDGDPRQRAQVPLASVVSLRFESGAVGSVASARVLPARHRVALHLVGEGYAVELTEGAIVEHELSLTTATGTEIECSRQDPIAAEDRAFLDAVTGTRNDVRCSYAEALRTHALACAAERGRANGEPTDAPT